MLVKGSSGELNDTQRSVLGIAYNGSQQMLEMVNLLLDISRLESKRMPLNRTPQPFEPLVTRAASRLLPQARNKAIAIQTDIAKTLPLAYADGELVVRVLQNLIDNALKFSGEGSTIVVRATIERAEQPIAQPVGNDALPLGNELMLQGDIDEPMFLIHPNRIIKIAVIDRGVGIAPKDQTKVFDKFGQVGERRGGSGLGLTFCKLVAEAHGGTIGVSSVPNEGSTFFFTLPIVVVEG
jgi:signal transduction histidine kinase